MSTRAFSLRGLALRRLDDEALLARAREGQEVAFAELYRRFHGLVYGYCLARLMDPSAADDVAQDTFLRINRSGAADEIHSARAWIFTVARSAVIDHVRRVKRAPASVSVDDDFDVASNGPDAAEGAMRREDAKMVFLALARLRPRYRTALVMREMHGMSSAEIGDALELKSGAVDTLVCRARDAFGREYAGLAALSPDCRRAVEYIYRERGSGIDAAERGWLDDHVSGCPRCAREHGLASDPKRLAMLLPLMSVRPEGLSILQRAMDVFGSAPASVEAVGMMAVKVTAVAVATTIAVSPMSGGTGPRRPERNTDSGPVAAVIESGVTTRSACPSVPATRSASISPSATINAAAAAESAEESAVADAKDVVPVSADHDRSPDASTPSEGVIAEVGRDPDQGMSASGETTTPDAPEDDSAGAEDEAPTEEPSQTPAPEPAPSAQGSDSTSEAPATGE